ncbi:hypothetical protein LY78DRAFT_394740 [Colletotrichum sublineola]|nr:hypothetical protein LY78DRAFT_394740 [Colletotrichum sublineola]
MMGTALLPNILLGLDRNNHLHPFPCPSVCTAFHRFLSSIAIGKAISTTSANNWLQATQPVSDWLIRTGARRVGEPISIMPMRKWRTVLGCPETPSGCICSPWRSDWGWDRNQNLGIRPFPTSTRTDLSTFLISPSLSSSWNTCKLPKAMSRDAWHLETGPLIPASRYLSDHWTPTPKLSVTSWEVPLPSDTEPYPPLFLF